MFECPSSLVGKGHDVERVGHQGLEPGGLVLEALVQVVQVLLSFQFSVAVSHCLHSERSDFVHLVFVHQRAFVQLQERGRVSRFGAPPAGVLWGRTLLFDERMHPLLQMLGEGSVVESVSFFAEEVGV